MAREINLVPDVKNEMIKALKLRNLIFFICIIVAIACVVIIIVFGSIVGGQQIAVNTKEATITKMSDKLNSYDGLSDFLTIRDQLGNLQNLSSNKKVLSRTFNILSALIPTGADTVTISEMTVNLGEVNPTFSFDAQANAGKEPYIDYNVLDSFKKSMQYMRYDYGRYVDKEGAEIPAYCIIENADDGSVLYEEGKGIYAYWTIAGEGCNPSKADYVSQAELDAEEEERKAEEEAAKTPDLQNLLGNNNNLDDDNKDEEENSEEDENDSDDENNDKSNSSKKHSEDAYATEEYGNPNEDGEYTPVVKIWRTPQYDDWYEKNYMTEDGDITGVPHFNSECITYKGEQTNEKSKKLKWSETNDNCKLVPDGDNGIKISDSSNGRGAGDELVLRFSAVISLEPEVYSFNNYHMLAIAPTGRRNVTDSYVQIQAMFGEKARDCDPGDTSCTGNTTNLRGGN